MSVETGTNANTPINLTDEQIAAEVEAFLSTIQPPVEEPVVVEEPVEDKPYVSMYGLRYTAIWWANYNASRGYRP